MNSLDKFMNSLFRSVYCSDREDSITYMIFRMFVGFALLYHGLAKATGDPLAFVGFVRAQHIPFPEVLAPMAIFAEIIGGILLATGLFTKIASYLIFVTMYVAAFIVNASNGFAGMELPLLYMVSSLVFMTKGAGRHSLDYLLISELSKCKCFKGEIFSCCPLDKPH